MNLMQLINQYINYRKAMGANFRTNEIYLKAFCKRISPLIMVSDITENMVNQFLYGNNKLITETWFSKRSALLGFYRYAYSRDYVSDIPLPQILPKHPQTLVPYIYTSQELKNLFDAALTYQKSKSHIQPYTVRAILILTYTLGLRIHETLSIKLADMDLNESIITIQQTKFFKSRLIPFNQQIRLFLVTYLQRRAEEKQSQLADSLLFADNKNNPLKMDTIHGVFQRIREKAGIKRIDGGRYQPRIHDLRHTFVVKRLASWYQDDKDVQQLLPILSTYIGHARLADTSVYLTMTDELLQAANNKFENYVFTGE